MAIANIKTKLKEDFSFIKNDGKVLSYLATELLSENNNDLQKTLDFIDTLCKKDVQTRMDRIMNDLETASEISLIIKDEIKKDNDKLVKVKNEIDELEETIEELEDTKTELEETITELKINFEKKQNEIKLEQDFQNEKIRKEMEILTNARDKLHTELTEIQSNIDSIFENSYDNEFNYEECDYIIKEPMIHLDVNKAIGKIYGFNVNNFNLEYNHLIDVNSLEKRIRESAFPDARYEVRQQKNSFSLNFPINHLLTENEFIIKVYLIKASNNSDFTGNSNHGYQFSDYNNLTLNIIDYVIYLTNYGRFIVSKKVKTGYIKYNMGNSISSIVRYCLHGNVNTFINNSYCELNNYILNIELNYPEPQHNIILYKKVIDDIPHPFILPKLLYRMPRLFLDVIDAFHTQNNDLMQDCCKKYLSIARAKGTEKDIIDNIEYDRTIQNKDSIIIEKNKIIETQNEIIEKQKEDIEKMKLEIAKLKSALKVLSS